MKSATLTNTDNRKHFWKASTPDDFEMISNTGYELVGEYLGDKVPDLRDYLLKNKHSGYWNWWQRQYELEHCQFTIEYMPTYEDNLEEYGEKYANKMLSKAYLDHVKSLIHAHAIHERLRYFIIQQKIYNV